MTKLAGKHRGQFDHEPVGILHSDHPPDWSERFSQYVMTNDAADIMVGYFAIALVLWAIFGILGILKYPKIDRCVLSNDYLVNRAVENAVASGRAEPLPPDYLKSRISENTPSLFSQIYYFLGINALQRRWRDAGKAAKKEQNNA